MARKNHREKTLGVSISEKEEATKRREPKWKSSLNKGGKIDRLVEGRETLFPSYSSGKKEARKPRVEGKKNSFLL